VNKFNTNTKEGIRYLIDQVLTLTSNVTVLLTNAYTLMFRCNNHAERRPCKAVSLSAACDAACDAASVLVVA
jgi:hypothetical protein